MQYLSDCLYSTVVVRLTCNQKVSSSILDGGWIDGGGCDVRAVKEIDLKSIGLCPRRFKSCSQRIVMLPERLTGQTANLMGFCPHKFESCT